MDNVIQNIKIEDIVPRSHHQNNENFKELEDLAITIKENGIKEPLIVKKKDNRYEIILGDKIYKAAVLAGISTIPVIIKNNYDNDLIKDIKENTNISLNSIYNNSDIINLSELNKEYERDDYNMNNELLNNNNNTNQPTNNGGTIPTFGGRFFPSLEDQPTNMSFDAPIDTTIPPSPLPNNNFIDLTDTSNIGKNNINVTTQVAPTPVSIQSENVMNNNIPPQNTGNVINLENLTQNNGAVQPTPTSIPNASIDSSFQDIISDFQPNPVSNITQQPVQQEEPAIPTVHPNIQPEILTPIMNNQINTPQDIIPTLVSETQNVAVLEPVIQPSIDTQVVNPVIQPEVTTPVQPIPEINPTPVQTKDVLPVINTLKAVAVNLESFGYTIRITDEALPTSYKITIEVEK